MEEGKLERSLDTYSSEKLLLFFLRALFSVCQYLPCKNFKNRAENMWSFLSEKVSGCEIKVIFLYLKNIEGVSIDPTAPFKMY